MTCVYEVNLSVNADIDEKFMERLKHHVQDMVNQEGFLSAAMTDRKHADEGAEDDGKKLHTCSYIVESRDVLETYFKEKAAEMRKEMLDAFPPIDSVPQFTATRKIHNITQKFTKTN
eukprot:TRINITY_DN6548_c0_g2_i1.p1 TRINITY_DN6548_c0_g2~~TRINITY_DN6548_c0_g2_i1.p1  ORF type:complete len:134 (+),score=51.61 TRINITY_DN6548_c0_g2_i1:52-402(+)